MENISIEHLSKDNLLSVAPFIKDKALCNFDKTLSFVLFDENIPVGIALMAYNDIPSNSNIKNHDTPTGNGCEIKQIIVIDSTKEPVFIKRISNRVQMWVNPETNNPFDYMWSTELGSSTHFFSDVLNGDYDEILLSKYEKKDLLICIFSNE